MSFFWSPYTNSRIISNYFLHHEKNGKRISYRWRYPAAQAATRAASILCQQTRLQLQPSALTFLCAKLQINKEKERKFHIEKEKVRDIHPEKHPHTSVWMTKRKERTTPAEKQAARHHKANGHNRQTAYPATAWQTSHTQDVTGDKTGCLFIPSATVHQQFGQQTDGNRNANRPPFTPHQHSSHLPTNHPTSHEKAIRIFSKHILQSRHGNTSDSPWVLLIFNKKVKLNGWMN